MPSLLSSLLMATPLVIGAHEGSHQAEADSQGVQMRWNKVQGEFLPLWEAMDKGDKDRLARIANSGLIGQQEFVGRLPDGNLKKAALFVSALNKIGYGLMPGGAGASSEGDMGTLNRAKGQNMAPVALGLSGLADLYRAKNPDTKWSLDFAQTQNGTPGLMYRRPW